MTFKPHLLLCLMSVSLVTQADNRALLVGIDEYKYINELIGSKQDVENMREFIESEWGYQPAQISTLTDAQATRSNILSTIDNWLIRDTRRGDKVLFYYSGHGTYVKDNWPYDEKDGSDEALCPVNTTLSRDNLIRDDEIHERLKKLEGRQVTLIIDACHSGTMTKSVSFASPTVKTPIFRRPLPRKTTKSAFTRETFVNTQRHVVAYSAVAPDEVALVDTHVNPREGVFTRRFIEGIRDKYADSNYDGKVSHQEVLAYTRRESQAYCDNSRYQCRQGLTPQLEIKSDRLDQDIRTWAAIKDTMPPPLESIEPRFNEELQLEILPAYPQPGQRMRIRITSERNGYVLLFDVSRLEGANPLKHLFYNPYNQQGNYIKAGKPLTIPDHYSGVKMIANSPGERFIVALLVNSRHELTTLEQALPEVFKEVISKQADTFQRALPAQRLSQQLTQQLNQKLWRKEISQNWSISTLAYEILD